MDRPGFVVILLLFLILSCNRSSSIKYVRSTFRCCSADCINREHLITEEFFDSENKQITIKHYHPDDPHLLSRVVRYEYSDGGKSLMVDSTEFNTHRTMFLYENNLLTKTVTARHRKTVVNEPMDTVPHTRWTTSTDTIIHLFHYHKNKLMKETELAEGDTLMIREVQYNQKGQVYLIHEGSTRIQYTYFPNDSISKIEYFNLSVSGSNVTLFTYDDARWMLFKTIEFTYDSLSRKTEEMHYDNLDLLIYHFRYTYTPEGKLASIREKDICDTLIYNTL